MTYEDYKNNKSGKIKESKNIIRIILNKLFTIIIFSLIVISISNYSPKFRKFLNDKVLNSTFDFSFANKLVNNITDVFKSKNTIKTSIINDNYENYKDGVKYFVGENYEVLCKSSGIVTFIGEKDGYNNTIIIQQSDGFYAWYGNVTQSVKVYDYIEEVTILGVSSNEYYYALFKDDKPISVNEY